MKYLLVALVLSISNDAMALEGTNWLEVNKENYITECPDFIKFETGTYTILNDCYSENPAEPVIEQGRYKFEGNRITFERSEVVKNLSFLNSDLASSIKVNIIRKSIELACVCWV